MYQRHQSDSGEIHVTFDKLLRSFYAKFTSDISHAHDHRSRFSANHVLSSDTWH